MSCETTFRATNNREELCEIIRQLSFDLSEDLARYKITGRNVTLKYKTEAFDVKTRATQLVEPTADGTIIAKAAIRLLTSEPPDLILRLLGVRMSQLATPASSSGNMNGRKQRTLDELVLECAPKRRKLDEDVATLFTCPVCHSWRTPDGDVALNRHIDECLNQQVLLAESGPSSANQKQRAKQSAAAQSKIDRFFTRK